MVVGLLCYCVFVFGWSGEFAFDCACCSPTPPARLPPTNPPNHTNSSNTHPNHQPTHLPVLRHAGADVPEALRQGDAPAARQQRLVLAPVPPRVVAGVGVLFVCLGFVIGWC